MVLSRLSQPRGGIEVKVLLWILITAIIAFIVVAIYSCFIMSGRMSEKEDEQRRSTPPT